MIYWLNQYDYFPGISSLPSPCYYYISSATHILHDSCFLFSQPVLRFWKLLIKITLQKAAWDAAFLRICMSKDDLSYSHTWLFDWIWGYEI